MKMVVIGGQSRGVGKTSVVAGIVAALPHLNWTAVKITQHGHGICSASGEPCACSVTAPDCPYAIDEERDSSGRSDTSRFLRAGAKRSLWVRTPMNQLDAAMPALHAALNGAEYVIIESNSVMDFIQPDLYLAVLDPAVTDFKPSLRRLLDRADAYIALGDGVASDKPVYRTERGVWLTPEVVRFVQHHVEN